MLLVLGVTFALICKEAPSLAWLEPLERFPNIGHSFDLSVTASAVQSLIIANCACLPVPLISFQNLMRPGPRFICLGWWGDLLLAMLTLLLYAKHRRAVSLLSSAELEQGI